MRYLIILSVVAVTTFTGCKSGTGSREGNNHETEKTTAEHGEEIIFTPEQAEAAALTIETVEPGSFDQVIKTSGQIQVPQGAEAVVAASTSGIVSFAGSFTEGMSVGKGQAIVSISGQNIVDGDTAAKARIEYETAEREFRRAEELVKDRIISERDFNEAQRRYRTARAALGSPTTELKSTSEGVTEAAAGVSVKSPIAGYVKNRLVDNGEYVSAGQSIATITTNGKLQLRADVPERYFDVLPTISAANFKTAYGETVYSADKMLSYGRAAEGAYIPMLFEFSNIGDVVPGTYAEVWLLGRPLENVISVPRSALTEEQGLYFVYVRLDEEGYEKREVSLGADNGERVQIRSGLNPGDRVVTRGAMQVRLAAMSGIIPEGHTH